MPDFVPSKKNRKSGSWAIICMSKSDWSTVKGLISKFYKAGAQMVVIVDATHYAKLRFLLHRQK